jgi:hypothetical protein
MDATERLLREIIAVINDTQLCDACMPLDEAYAAGEGMRCERRHYKRIRRAVQDANSLLRRLDRERDVDKNKPN